MSWRRALLTAAALLAFVYGAAYTDLVLRARSAYLEGEKWMEWSRKPELKKAHFDAILAAREKDLTKEREAGRLAPAAFTQKMGLARFERDQALSESSLKYAYVWYQTAAELFTPPESRWVVMSRARMKETRELWKKELDAKKVPYRDYMLD
ncbi:MAG: hypothetical protein A2506_12465 [Elusimicrobia bacterium RIFOXYD12_FULL_66_9]|nr:MAG: hypothetical protein A2506_12465 [Elusimicrobia bacterium RIFOXYD12_FULL_66_9]